MYTTKYKKGDKIKTRCGETLEYVGISRSQRFRSYIYVSISGVAGYCRCDKEWCKADKLPAGSIPFSEKLRGEKICK